MLFGKRILIVGDQEDLLQLLVVQTRSWGMRPHVLRKFSAGDWGIFTHPLHEEPFDLAILIRHPSGTSAQEFVEEMHRAGLFFPLILLIPAGGYKTDVEMEWFDSFLMQPFTTQQLCNTLMEIVVNLNAARLRQNCNR